MPGYVTFAFSPRSQASEWLTLSLALCTTSFFVSLLRLILLRVLTAWAAFVSTCGVGAPAATRTRDPLLRRQMLYPTELRAHLKINKLQNTNACRTRI